MRGDDYKSIVISGSTTNIGTALEAAIDKINQQLGTISFIKQSQSSIGVAGYGIVTVTIIYRLGRPGASLG
jgi:hypothetical protein